MTLDFLGRALAHEHDDQGWRWVREAEDPANELRRLLVELTDQPRPS